MKPQIPLKDSVQIIDLWRKKKASGLFLCEPSVAIGHDVQPNWCRNVETNCGWELATNAVS